MLDAQYQFSNGMWKFYLYDESFEYSEVGLIYDKDKPYDILLKHGDFEIMQKLFCSDQYSLLTKLGGCNLRLVKVKPIAINTLNKCLNISASKWCSKLELECSEEFVYVI